MVEVGGHGWTRVRRDKQKSGGNKSHVMTQLRYRKPLEMLNGCNWTCYNFYSELSIFIEGFLCWNSLVRCLSNRPDSWRSAHLRSNPQNR